VPDCMGHILLRNCCLKQNIEDNTDRMMEGARRRRRRRRRI